MGQGTGQNISKGSPERSSHLSALLPMALVLAVGASWYLLGATGAEGFVGVLFILTFGLAVAFGASMTKVRGFVMSVALATASAVGGLLGQGDVSRQFDDGAFFMLAEVLEAILVLFAWLGGVVIGSLWRWTGRRWSTRSDLLKRLITAVVLSLVALVPLVVGASFTVLVASLIAGPSIDVGPLVGPGRIERPEHGFALTFPGPWTVQEATPEGTVALLGEDGLLEGEVHVLAAERFFRRDTCFVFVDDPTERDEPDLLDFQAAWAEARLQSETNTEVKRARIDLAAGPAWRIDTSLDGVTQSYYMVRGPSGLYTLICSASDPPADRWLSIAETFEFLPEVGTGSVPSSPVFGGGRIERPTDGFAVTFPDDWTVEEVTPATHAWLFSDFDPEVRALRTTVLYADQPESDGYCTVVDFARMAEGPYLWTSVYAATSGFLAGFIDGPGYVEPKSTYLTLPAGRTGRITATDIDGWAYDTYYFTDSDAWFYLECRSPEPTAADWLHVAESFEFLPVEVGAGGTLAAEEEPPATGAFGPAGSLAEVRFFHTVTLLPDGRILIVGGGGGGDLFASAEVWDPATASFGPAGSLSDTRLFHTATLLPDGRVLVVGGGGFADDEFDFLASAEVWEPSDG